MDTRGNIIVKKEKVISPKRKDLMGMIVDSLSINEETINRQNKAISQIIHDVKSELAGDDIDFLFTSNKNSDNRISCSKYLERSQLDSKEIAVKGKHKHSFSIGFQSKEQFSDLLKIKSLEGDMMPIQKDDNQTKLNLNLV